MPLTTDKQARENITPWYKHRWPWILMSVPAFSVVLGIILVGTAMRNPAILVVDNYYAEGRGINRSLEMDNLAAEQGLQAHLTFREQNISVRINTDQEEALRLYVYHVTDDQRDQDFLLLPTADNGVYEFAASNDITNMADILNSHGSWYLDLRGADGIWRLRKRITTPITEVAL